MPRPLVIAPAVLLLAGCLQTAATAPATPSDAPSGVIADGPRPPVAFACVDGRMVEVSATMGGVILFLDGVAHDLPQISETTLAGNVHVAGNLGWISTPDWNGRLVEIGPDQTVETAPYVDCERRGPMPWEQN